MMNPQIKDSLKLLYLPLILGAIYLIGILILKIFNIDIGSALTSFVGIYFSKYWFLIVFASALIEGFFILGQYFPGGAILFLSIVAAGKDVGRAIEVMFLISLAFLIAYALNYLVGKFGWNKLLIKLGLEKPLEMATKKLRHQEFITIIFSYWDPNIASITATAAGILGISFKKFLFYSIIAILAWNTFWSTLAFILGNVLLKYVGVKYFVLIFIIWMAAIIGKDIYDKRKEGLR